MITKDVLQKLKLTPEELKKKFSSKNPSDKINDLKNLTRSRIDEGRKQNLADFRLWWAMDLAYDVTFKQTSFSILDKFLENVGRNDLSKKDVIEAAKSWGLSQFITDVVKDGKTCKQVDLPVFFRIHIPLVRAYLNIRWAKLYADRNTFPLLKYEPAKSTAKNRAKCEVITDVIEAMGQQMGYRQTLRQWIFNCLHYGTAIMFPTEDWYKESEPYVDSKGGIKYRNRKQGLRYAIPHPSRVFYDQMHRIGTVNSDSGIKFAGYWRIVRYKDILDNPAYWNTDQVSMMGHDLIQNNGVFFATVYPCTFKFPDVAPTSRSGAGDLDRESAATFYTTDHEDKAVVLTEIHQKLVPKDWGLGDVNSPIWFRFLVANDSDIIYCAPLCYTPPLYMGYDAHEERRRNASLTLEVMPFQDHMSNLLSQQILTAKQNLLQVTFANKDLIGEQYLKQIQNHGEDLYRELIIIPYSSRKTTMMQGDIKQAFTNIKFPVASTVELMSAFRLLLDTLERVLVFSAQEVGAIAAHEQTAEETRIIAGSVNNRVALTDSFIDDAIYAWKVQLYNALMAYGEKRIYAQVSAAPPSSPEMLEELGFTIDEAGIPGQTNTQINGAKEALDIEGFVSGREGENRINNPEIAIAMSQFMQIMMNNQITAMAIGPEQAIEIFNVISRIAGLPRDFKLHVANPELVKKMMSGAQDPEQQKQMQQMFEQLTVEILNKAGEQAIQIAQKAVQPMEKAHEQIVKALEQNGEDVADLSKAVDAILSRLNALAEAASVRAAQSGAG